MKTENTLESFRRYLKRLGWTVELAQERKASSMQYARDCANGIGHPSTKFLFVELARKYSGYIRILK